MVLSNRAKLRRKKIRQERRISKIFNCRICGKYLGANDKHHILCNICWNESHPFETMINRKKSRKW